MISIVIATYNDLWVEHHKDFIAKAIASVRNQTADEFELLRVHGDTLFEARNAGALQATGSRLVFLDADDWLDPEFVSKIVQPEDVLQPKTCYITEPDELVEPTWLEPYEDLYDGNHLIVGSPVNRELFLDVGGFDDLPVFEDWALWLKMRKAGATFGRTEAVYNVRVRTGRNDSANWGDMFGYIRRNYA